MFEARGSLTRGEFYRVYLRSGQSQGLQWREVVRVREVRSRVVRNLPLPILSPLRSLLLPRPREGRYGDHGTKGGCLSPTSAQEGEDLIRSSGTVRTESGWGRWSLLVPNPGNSRLVLVTLTVVGRSLERVEPLESPRTPTGLLNPSFVEGKCLSLDPWTGYLSSRF